MSTNLYEVLGLGRNATTEEIRKAYRRKALETHPDRLPQGASPAEKSAHEDMFRKVNNAYEVLQDQESRATYDQCGIWPPPVPAAQGPSANGPHQPFSDPFFRDPFFNDPFSRGHRTDPFVGGFAFDPRPGGPRGFTDPFILFNSIFGDFQRAFESDPPFFDNHTRGRHGFGSNPFGSGFFNNSAFMLPPPFDFGGGGMGGSRMQTFSSAGNGGHWVTQSWSSSTVNGVTCTKAAHRDSDGNEHVVYHYPDGTERRTVNGVEQSTPSSMRALPAPALPAPPVPHPTRSDGMPAPPPYYDAVAQPPTRSRSSRHHGHHHDHSGHRHEDRDRHGHRHSRDKERDRSGEYEADHDGHGYRDDRYGSGHDAHDSSPWKFWKS